MWEIEVTLQGQSVFVDHVRGFHEVAPIIARLDVSDDHKIVIEFIPKEDLPYS